MNTDSVQSLYSGILLKKERAIDTWVDLKSHIMLSERNQTQETTYYESRYMKF